MERGIGSIGVARWAYCIDGASIHNGSSDGPGVGCKNLEIIQSSWEITSAIYNPRTGVIETVAIFNESGDLNNPHVQTVLDLKCGDCPDFSPVVLNILVDEL